MARETMPSFVSNVGRALVLGPLFGLGIVYALSHRHADVNPQGPISLPVANTAPSLCTVLPESVVYTALGRHSLAPAFSGNPATPACTWVRSDLAGALSVSVSRDPHDLAEARALSTPPLVAGLHTVAGVGRRAVVESGLSTVTAILTDGRVLQVKVSRNDGAAPSETDATAVQIARTVAAALTA